MTDADLDAIRARIDNYMGVSSDMHPDMVALLAEVDRLRAQEHTAQLICLEGITITNRKAEAEITRLRAALEAAKIRPPPGADRRIWCWTDAVIDAHDDAIDKALRGEA